MPVNQMPNGKGHYSRHRGERYEKRNYASRWQARKSMMRRWVLDWIEMGTYPCTGGKQHENGKLHYHFGHSSARERWEGWKDLQQYRFKRRVLFPLYTVRRRVRHLLDRTPDTGYMSGNNRRAKNNRRNHNAARRKHYEAQGTPWTQCPKHGPQEVFTVPGVANEPTCVKCI